MISKLIKVGDTWINPDYVVAITRSGFQKRCGVHLGHGTSVEVCDINSDDAAELIHAKLEADDAEWKRQLAEPIVPEETKA